MCVDRIQIFVYIQLWGFGQNHDFFLSCTKTASGISTYLRGIIILNLSITYRTYFVRCNGVSNCEVLQSTVMNVSCEQRIATQLSFFSVWISKRSTALSSWYRRWIRWWCFLNQAAACERRTQEWRIEGLCHSDFARVVEHGYCTQTNPSKMSVRICVTLSVLVGLIFVGLRYKMYAWLLVCFSLCVPTQKSS